MAAISGVLACLACLPALCLCQFTSSWSCGCDSPYNVCSRDYCYLESTCGSRNKAGATANASKTVGLPTLKSFNTSLKANWSSVPNNSTRSRTTAGFNWDCNCEFGYFYCSVLYCYKNCHGVLEIPDGGHRRREGGRRRGTVGGVVGDIQAGVGDLFR